MMEHTSGPWVTNATDGQSNAAAVWTGDQRKFICSTNGKAPSRYSVASELVQDANARLIAAAPELLAALKALLPEGWGDDDTMDHIPGVKQARAAIAKAEGK